MRAQKEERKIPREVYLSQKRCAGYVLPCPVLKRQVPKVDHIPCPDARGAVCRLLAQGPSGNHNRSAIRCSVDGQGGRSTADRCRSRRLSSSAADPTRSTVHLRPILHFGHLLKPSFGGVVQKLQK